MGERSKQSSKKLSREDWRAHYEAWVSSSESQTTYCERHGLNYASFYYWRTQLSQNSDRAKSRFETLTVPAPQHASSNIRIHLPNGIQLSISASAQLGLVSDVLQLLGVSTC
ncbi:MAG: hypothetical protein COV52_10390 [Gammaproteobacteria bacterium CG11_big_fil_rev_8_21_14_0_20_46_22]|nr:MAG: hypothetical protein COW05_09615 [Gammaproteobacteria bacterium CG12_big_fil_rev_8_21_14_0_65_46_12]PIR10104.1 MAG: hypothetical protein COV52_10390 [Gammaproteobacteria bacterium CG11_big_fil_rev_8_21_14_0_20_46_22]